jgi:phosphoribosyl 1,2-cyclic phosphodiesterase
MRFASLGSGSRGNATLLEAGGVRVLVDCGFAAREAERRLHLLGVPAGELDAILLTHEHVDHVRGVQTLARRHRLEVWSTPGTWRRLSGRALDRLRLFSGHDEGFHIGGLKVLPFPVPHDAREPCQFVFESGGHRLAVLTDTGYVTEHIRARLRECDALLLECNHDAEMLRRGSYPASVQARVGGCYGHLSNRQAAELLDSLPHRGLRHLLVGHVSEQNNHPNLAKAALLSVSPGLASRIVVAEQGAVTPWLAL